MKYLGFSLDEIKNRLAFLDTPSEVAALLDEQAADIKEKVASLTESLEIIGILKEEVIKMQTVDFKKYADIIVNLQMKNDYYWLIKHIDGGTLDGLRTRFDKESALAVIKPINRILDKAVHFHDTGVKPDSRKGQELAESFWEVLTGFAGGDMSLIPKFAGLIQNADTDDKKQKQKQDSAMKFLEPALDFYFTKNGINPFSTDEGAGNDRNE
jgi:frataxin-like iron-binding protein CyaY